MNPMKKAGLLVGVLISANIASADEVVPSSIKTGGPIHFITNSLTSSTPVTDVETFKYSVKVNTDESIENVYYFPTQFFSKNGSLYSGIQPHVDGTVSFTFSSFTKDTVTTDPNCSLGADGSPNGASCSTKLSSYAAGKVYTIEVKRTAADDKLKTYVGTVKDEETGVVTQIGSWSVPAGVGALEPSTIVAFERYSSKRFQVKSCADVPVANAEFSNVIFNDSVYTKLVRTVHPKAGSKGIYTCSGAGVPLAVNGKYTATQTGFIIGNDEKTSDDKK